MGIRKLKILMSYPIKWDFYKILRDYIQNFYDAIGPDSFIERFKFNYDRETEELKMSSDTTFDKEWLFYIGASAKRNDKVNYAGKFGEGFKVASLVAYRDFNLSITMESGSWHLEVTEAEQRIDSTTVRCLAYDISDREYAEDSILILKGISQKNYELFIKVIEDFYYEDNPVFGNKIYSNADYALYLSNEKHGFVYAAYQRRKKIELPLIVCCHRFESSSDDRDRDDLRASETVGCIYNVIGKLDPDSASVVLEKLERFWDGRTRWKNGIAPAAFIRDLIYIIARDEKSADKILNKYRDQIIANCSKYLSGSRKKIALSWFRNSGYYHKKRIVIHQFMSLGFDDIEKLCNREGGFEVVRDPTQIENSYISVLKEAAEKWFADIYQYEKLPDCKVIINDNAPVKGLAYTRRKRHSAVNNMGLTIVKETDNILLSRKILCCGSFGDAMSVYLHELLHQYGGDKTLQFHKALIYMNYRIAEIGEDFNFYIQRWEAMHKEV